MAHAIDSFASSGLLAGVMALLGARCWLLALAFNAITVMTAMSARQPKMRPNTMPSDAVEDGDDDELACGVDAVNAPSEGGKVTVDGLKVSVNVSATLTEGKSSMAVSTMTLPERRDRTRIREREMPVAAERASNTLSVSAWVQSERWRTVKCRVNVTLPVTLSAAHALSR